MAAVCNELSGDVFEHLVNIFVGFAAHFVNTTEQTATATATALLAKQIHILLVGSVAVVVVQVGFVTAEEIASLFGASQRFDQVLRQVVQRVHVVVGKNEQNTVGKFEITASDCRHTLQATRVPNLFIMVESQRAFPVRRFDKRVEHKPSEQ
ncbi:hypothetical protein T4B_14631 [Trichinella pseudospiralis]|uniref:Uncharacterized protein n=1 Tax=Trichinella pseudospiralis TaxID=6337 RepID=A0A0V1HXZ5_TRIPS|nr:hypothetical protein T4B_14631 [Trichinella pseudospiralis]